MNKKAKILSILAACAVTAGVVSAAVLTRPATIAEANDNFTIVLDESNFQLTDAYASGEITVKTEYGNDIVFAYENAMTPASGNTGFAQLKKTTGVIYNKTPLNGIVSVTVNYTSGSPLSQPVLAYGLEANPTEGNAIATGTAADGKVGYPYLALRAGLHARYVDSIEISYTCIAEEPLPEPYEAADVAADIGAVIGEELMKDGLDYWNMLYLPFDTEVEEINAIASGLVKVANVILSNLDYLAPTSDLKAAELTTGGVCVYVDLVTNDWEVDVELLAFHTQVQQSEDPEDLVDAVGVQILVYDLAITPSNVTAEAVIQYVTLNAFGSAVEGEDYGVQNGKYFTSLGLNPAGFSDVPEEALPEVIDVIAGLLPGFFAPYSGIAVLEDGTHYQVYVDPELKVAVTVYAWFETDSTTGNTKLYGQVIVEDLQ